MNLERLPSIVAFSPEVERATKPRTLGSVIGQLQREQRTIATYKVKAPPQKLRVMERVDDRLLWQIAVLEDIRNQEQFRVMQ